MGMRLKHNRSGTNHFSPLPSVIARRADSLKPAVGSRQRIGLRQCSLTSRLPGSIHIDYQPLLARPIEEAARRRKRLTSKQILVKERAERFHTALIKSRKKARQGCAMRQAVTAEEGHIGSGERGEPFVKGKQGWFPRQGVADQDGDKINEIVLAEAGTGETHLFGDGGECALVGKHPSKSGYFSHPGRHGRL